jgi:heme/copper-type cytochrome/quinol oxidase subunit 2
MKDFPIASKTNRQKMQAMSHGLSNFLGARVACLYLASVAFARGPFSMSNTLTPAFTPIRYIADLPIFLVWSTGNIFLVAGGLLASAPIKFRARNSDSLFGLAQVYRSTEIDVAWTAIPVLAWIPMATVRLTARINARRFSQDLSPFNAS